MTTQQFLVFLALLILPSAYQRTKFAIRRSAFMTTRLRDRSRLAIHHGHWGLLCVFISSISMAFGYHNWLMIVLVGYGWGLISDEIMPMLKMPTVGRDIELQVYARMLPATGFLIAVVVCICIAVFLASRSIV